MIILRFSAESYKNASQDISLAVTVENPANCTSPILKIKPHLLINLKGLSVMMTSNKEVSDSSASSIDEQSFEVLKESVETPLYILFVAHPTVQFLIL